MKWNAFWQWRKIQLNGNLMLKPVAFLTQKICCSNHSWQLETHMTNKKRNTHRFRLKTKEQFIVWKARFDLFESYSGTTQLTHAFFFLSSIVRKRRKKWQLVKLCANWKAVKSGLICMESKWKMLFLSEQDGEWEMHIEPIKRHACRFNSLIHTHHSSHGQEFVLQKVR